MLVMCIKLAVSTEGYIFPTLSSKLTTKNKKIKASFLKFLHRNTVFQNISTVCQIVLCIIKP